MKFYIGCDHAGYPLKEDIKAQLIELGYEIKDFGTFSTESVDYPDFAHKVAKSVITDEGSRGILICGTGLGMTYTANRYKGIRAALVSDKESAKMSRAHNDANILVIAGRLTDKENAITYLDIFINTPFDGGRHIPRIEKIDEVLDV